LQTSARDRERLRAIMVRIRADHGFDVLRKASRRASMRLARVVEEAMDLFDDFSWVVGTELGPDAMCEFSISSISADRVRKYPEHPPLRCQPLWQLLDRL
jgi:hypothetical protein